MLNTKEIEALRAKQLGLLAEVDRICKKHKIQYWVDFGTLLGAVRNGRFIPWDDDIDISMLAVDYERFISVAQKEVLPGFFLQTEKTDVGYFQCFAKLRDSNSTFIEHHETGNEPYNQGIFIDIFPAYHYPAMPKLLRMVMQRATVRARSATVAYPKSFLRRAIYTGFSWFWRFMAIFPKVAFGQIPEDNGYMYATELTALFPLSEIVFEGVLVPCPNNPHIHLRNMYGKSYMMPPPESKRVPHARLILPTTPYLIWRSTKQHRWANEY